MKATDTSFITQKELLKRIPVCANTLDTYIEAGNIPVIRLSRVKLFHWPSVEEALIKLQTRAQDA